MPREAVLEVVKSLEASPMNARLVLAQNIERLRQAATPPLNYQALERATAMKGCRVGKSTLQRAATGSAPMNLDYLEAIAKVFNLDPWQLLVPDLRPEAVPKLADSKPIRRAIALKLVRVARELSPEATTVFSTEHTEEDPWKKPPT